MKEGWSVKTLDDVSLIKGRIGYRGYTKNDLVNNGEGAISLSPSNIRDNKLSFENCTYISWDKYHESPEIMINEGDIIFCKTASIGKMALVEYLPEKATLNPQFVVLKNINCNNKYLYYFMSSEDFNKQVSNIIGGTSIPTLSQKNLGSLKLPFPPLPEQQRIVSIIDKAFEAIDKAIENTQKNLQNAKELFESYLNSVFENGGEGWGNYRLKEITLKIGSGATPSGGQENYKEHGISLIRSMNVYDLQFNSDKLAFIDDEQARLLNNVTLEEGDVLLNITGASIARCCVVPNSYLPARVNQHVSILRPNPAMINSFFLNLMLTARYYKNQLLFTGEQGSTRQALTKLQLESFQIKMPSMEEQLDIVEETEQIKIESQKIQSLYQQKLRDLEELKKSILNKAFAGEL